MSQIAKGIYLRGKTYWYAIQNDGKRRFISLKTDVPAEAVTRAALVKRDESFQATKSQGLDADIRRYLAAKAATTKHHSSTTKWAGRALKQFSKHVKNRLVKDITQQDIEGFYASMRKRIKPNGQLFSENAAHSYMRAVRGFMSWAVMSKLRFDNPAKLVKLGKPSQAARTKFATIAERDLIIQKTTDPSLKFILFCTFHAGMRFNEIVQARPDWFNLQGGYVTIQKTATFIPKNRKNRSVPLTTPFKQFLKSYGLQAPFMLKPKIKQRKSSYRYDFRVPWKGHLASVTKTLTVKAKNSKKPTKADLTWITPHLARHTFASILAQKGVSIYKIAEWLGDTLEVCTKHYAHLAPSDNAIDALVG